VPPRDGFPYRETRAADSYWELKNGIRHRTTQRPGLLRISISRRKRSPVRFAPTFRSSSRNRASILFGPTWAAVADAWTCIPFSGEISRERQEIGSCTLKLSFFAKKNRPRTSDNFFPIPLRIQLYGFPNPSPRGAISVLFLLCARFSPGVAVRTPRETKKSQNSSLLPPSRIAPLQAVLRRQNNLHLNKNCSKPSATPGTTRAALVRKSGGVPEGISGFAAAPSDLPRTGGKACLQLRGQHPRRPLTPNEIVALRPGRYLHDHPDDSAARRERRRSCSPPGHKLCPPGCSNLSNTVPPGKKIAKDFPGRVGHGKKA